MAVYTYVGNLSPSERTSRLVLRGGGLIMDVGTWADLTVQEVDYLDDRYVLVPGVLAGTTQAQVGEGYIPWSVLENLDIGFKTKSSAINPAFTVAVGTSSTALVASNAARLRLYVHNEDLTDTIYLALGAAAVVGRGIVIPPGLGEPVTNWTGTVNAIATGDGANAACCDI